MTEVSEHVGVFYLHVDARRTGSGTTDAGEMFAATARPVRPDGQLVPSPG